MVTTTKQDEVLRILQRQASKKRSKDDSVILPLDTPGNEITQPWCVYETSSMHVLVRVAGLILNAFSKPGYKVFARGQACFCDEGRMLPAISRGLGNVGACSIEKRMSKLLTLRKEIAGSLPKNNRFQDDAILAVLQHYGIRTHWLDVVDNLFVALWFACNSRTETQPYSYFSANTTGHLYLLQVEDGQMVTNDWECRQNAQLSGGERAKWRDLRREHTSLSLRPHAQHAVMISRICEATPSDVSQLDLTDSVLAEIRFPAGSKISEFMSENKRDLMPWMFPPMSKDDTYSRLRRGKVLKVIRSVVGNHTTELGDIDLYV